MLQSIFRNRSKRFDRHRECAESCRSIDPGVVLWPGRDISRGARAISDCPDNYHDGSVDVAAVENLVALLLSSSFSSSHSIFERRSQSVLKSGKIERLR